MRKVLIAIDYNPCAKKVAESGFKYASAMNAKICIVHAIRDIAYYSMEYLPVMGFEGFSSDCVFKNVEQQQNEAKRFLAAVTDYLGSTNIETKVLDGKASETILEFAKEWHADMIVMGSQSHNGLEKLIMGDVVATVVKNAQIPILIVPSDKNASSLISTRYESLQYI